LSFCSGLYFVWCGSGVCLSVCVSFTLLMYSAKNGCTDLDAVWWLTRVCLRNHAFDESQEQMNLFTAARVTSWQFGLLPYYFQHLLLLLLFIVTARKCS